MWDYLFEYRPYDTYEPEHTIGWVLLQIMVEGKPHLPRIEWVDWEYALWESRPVLADDIPW